MTAEAPPTVLVFAGHDPSGGAGIQADIEAIGAMGAHAATVITCLTIQDSGNVKALRPVEIATLTQQARTVLADYSIQAIKIGLIGSAEAAAAIASILAENPEIPVILDPVLAAGGGTELAGTSLIETMRKEILPRTFLTTPNSEEARRLAETDKLDDCAAKLLQTGCKSVLITGTHEESDSVINTLYQPGSKSSRSWGRLEGSYHGSGCTLASAASALIAAGTPLELAVIQAQLYTWRSLERAFLPGKGQFIPNRLPQRGREQ